MAFLGLLLALLCPTSQAAHYLSHKTYPDHLEVQTDNGPLILTFHTEQAVEVAYQPPGIRQLPSFSIAGPPSEVVEATLDERGDTIVYQTDAMAVAIEKYPLRLRYFHADSDGQPDRDARLSEETGLFAHDSQRGFRFQLAKGEQLIGGGERVFGKMDRRGTRLPLYNKAHYGYETSSRQMYFSLPAALSDRGYLLLFDNSARGVMDLGKREPDVMSFSANGGRTAYLVVIGDDTPDILKHYTAVTGRQPLPPRWTLGSYASRFGYRNQAQVLDTVARYRTFGFPLDAIVLDLYWFGADIKGHMGRLDWDRAAFPDPVGMLSALKKDGVRSILVTEPFILTTSDRWKEAVQAGALATDLAGRPKTFDFYFGNTGLIDVFKPAAMDWFYGIYRGLMQQGVDGWWGDLGEPEVHPRDAIHAIGSADSVHNAYGHQWAGGLYERLLRDRPDERPFIMMRAGAAGSQRFGMVPWTGDVSRSWGGLKPQVELALQMGQLGLGWTHSDLGGFAGGKRFDRELYVRWLQYGVFQPVLRPHAQDNIAAEPVFHDRTTRELLLPYLQLRYRMLPYNYTLAWQNSSTGMPMLRPLSFLDPKDASLYNRTDAYLWGDAFLVRPITAPGVRRFEFAMPKGVWFDYFSGQRYEGGRSHTIRTTLDKLPVFVRAGSFVPMLAEDITTTRDYSSASLQLHYWADSTVATASGQMYEDDGQTRAALTSDASEVLRFEASQDVGGLVVRMSRSGGDYTGRPVSRQVELVVHGWDGWGNAGGGRFDAAAKTLTVPVDWTGESMAVELPIR